MKPRYHFCAASVLLLTAAFASAQKLTSYGSGGFGMNSAYAKLYNPSTVITFHGKITGVTVAAPVNGVGNSVRIVVKARSGGSSLVEVGPEWFVDHQNVKLKPKENVTVTGSKIILDGRGSIMARKIVVGRKSMVLRDIYGNPYWSANSLAHGGSIAIAGATSQPRSTVAVQSARVPVIPYNGTQVVYMSRAVVNGAVDHFNDSNGNIFMTINIDGALREIYLGPDWFIQRQDMVINPGDEVTVNLLTPSDPRMTAYAESITSNGQTMFLRSPTGTTTWAPYYQIGP